MKSGFFAATFASVCLVSSLHAQTTEAGAVDPDLEKLLSVTKIQETVEKMSANMEKQISGNLRRTMENQKLPTEVISEALKAEQSTFKDMESEMSWNKLKPIYAKAFGETFTKEEVKGLIDFYQTPLGKALAEKLPQANQKAMEALQAKMQDLAPRIQKSVAEAVMKAMGKANGAKPVEPPAK